MEHPDERAWRMKKEGETDASIATLNHGILASLSPEALARVYGGKASSSRDYDVEFFLEMEREILGGNPLRAIERLDLDRQMRRHVPAAIWALRGLANLVLCRWSDASTDADRALMEAPDFAPSHAIKAEAALREGDYAWALALADNALSLNPDEPRGLGVRAAACYQSGRFQEAVEAATRALVLFPNYALPREARALAYRKLGCVNEARTEARVLLESEPDNTIAHHILRATK